MNKTALQTTETIRKSRFAPTVEMAKNEEGPIIGEIVRSHGFDIEADWTDIFPYWLVAKHEGEILGCIQVLPGKPIGRIEMLAMRTDLGDVKRAKVGWRLGIAALSTLSIAGSQLASSIIPFEHKRYKRLLKKRGWIVYNQGNLMMARVN